MAEGNKVYLFLGIGCGVLLLLLGCCAGGGYLAYRSVAASLPFAQAFVHDVQGGDYASALQRMDGTCQSQWTADQLRQQIEQQMPELPASNEFQVTGMNGENTNWTVDAAVWGDSTGRQDIVLTLRGEGDHYYVQRVQTPTATIQCP